MHNSILLIITLSVLLVSAPFIAKYLRLPTTTVEIILGSLMAFFGLITHNEYFDTLAHVGFLYLMLLAGMEVNLKSLQNSSKDVINKSVIFLLLMVMFTTIFGLILQFNFIVIISMSLISIGLLATLSKTYGKDEPWIKLAFIAGVLGEILSIAALTIFDVASITGFNTELFIRLGYLIIFLLVIYILYKVAELTFWWAPELKGILMPKSDISSQDIRLTMSLFFIMIAIMLSLELEMALGAFIAGIAISSFFHHEKKLEDKMSSLGFGFLVPLFFIHVGASFNLNALMISGVVSGALIITLIMIISRLLAAIALKTISGSRNALLIGLSLSMPLTLLIAVATIGYDTKLLDLLTYYQLILASIFEVLISMVAIKILKKNEKSI